jgi:folate-binding protein YgfZ
VTSHFDNPLVEQRELVAGKRVVELADRSVIQISGPDRHEWLNAMLSQRLDKLIAGDSAEALLLDAQGHIEQDFQIIEDGASTWLICFEPQATKLLRWFDMVIFRSKVEIRDAGGDYAIIASFGNPVDLVDHSNSIALVWQDPWMNEPVGSVRYSTAAERGPWNFYLSLVLRDRLGEQFALTPQAGQLALDALRVAAHRPWQPNEVDEKTLPHELDWLSSAVHLLKGCYRGQETVAKVHNLGHPPRVLAMLHLDGSANSDAQPGDQVWLGERLLGRVTTVGQHYELGPIALAVVARTADDTVDWWVASPEGDESNRGVAASGELVVPASAGAAAGIREKRQGLLG